MFIDGGLRRALKQEEFLLHYQPQIDLDSGAMIGAEVLIRWLHPERGLTYPKYFIAIAEACGLIVPIGQWMLREVLRQVQAWLDAGFSPVPVSVNISAMEFQDKCFTVGVETQEQLAFLRTRDCSVGQGFLFSHPLPAEDFARLLAGRDDPLSRRLPQPPSSTRPAWYFTG